MKKYFGYLKNHYLETFNIKAIGLTTLFLILSIWLNWKYDFEDSVIDSFGGSPSHGILFMFFQGLPFILTAIIFGYFKNDLRFLKSNGFWFTLVVAFAVLGFDRGFYFHRSIVYDMPRGAGIYVARIVKNLSGIVTVVIPLVLFYKLYDRKYQSDFYGVRKEGFVLQPYVIMFSIMIPLIIIASFTQDFLNTYPLYENARGPRFMRVYEVNEIFLKVIFEITYGFDFLSIELFFRGFLVLAFTRFLGKEVVYCMAVTYCYLHFGKPLGEAISSIFGGYILGVIALYSRNIWGGVLIHAGIAILMDVAAMLQKSL